MNDQIMKYVWELVNKVAPVIGEAPGQGASFERRRYPRVALRSTLG
jgi:hypothetical protein